MSHVDARVRVAGDGRVLAPGHGGRVVFIKPSIGRVVSEETGYNKMGRQRTPDLVARSTARRKTHSFSAAKTIRPWGESLSRLPLKEKP